MGFISLNLKIRIEAAYEKQQIPFLRSWNPVLLLLIVTLLITSVEAVTYWTPGYYEREYSKYNVTEDVHMEMDDLLDVTTEMMAYLRGNREDLHVPTIVDGQPREFFNDREIAHMEDVRGLFVGHWCCGGSASSRLLSAWPFCGF